MKQIPPATLDMSSDNPRLRLSCSYDSDAPQRKTSIFILKLKDVSAAVDELSAAV